MRGLACLCLAAGLLAGAPRAGGAVTPVVKNVNGWITALAMDGPQVAYATETFAPANCFKLFTWNVTTKAGVLVSGPRTGPCGSDEPHGQRIGSVAIAGPRLAWIRTISGNTESDDSLFTATLPRPREVELRSATRTGETSTSALHGDWLGGLVGSGGMLAANVWTTDASGAVTRASLDRVGAARLTRVASGPETLEARSADDGRVAVARADGSVAIYSASGRPLRTVAPGSVRQVALWHDDLVIITAARALEIYAAHTGALVRSRPVAGGAADLDASAGIAVYSVGRKLYGVALKTGRQVVLATAPRAIVAARIETPGVVYAYNTVRGLRTIGNLAFLPLRATRSALGG